MIKYALLVALAGILAACNATTKNTMSASREASAPPTFAASPMDEALACISAQGIAPSIRPVIGIGIIGNQTGVYDYEGIGSYVPADLSHAFTSAFYQAGLPTVLREGSTTLMIEWELNHAINNRLGKDGVVRAVPRGVLEGSDYLLVGAINRLDFDDSSGFEVSVNGIGVGQRSFQTLVGMDLALVNSRTGQVEWAQQYEKTYIGIDNKAGVFSFFGPTLVDINFGSKSNDPLHAGLIDLTNFAAFDIARKLYNAGEICNGALNPNSKTGE